MNKFVKVSNLIEPTIFSYESKKEFDIRISRYIRENVVQNEGEVDDIHLLILSKNAPLIIEERLESLSTETDAIINFIGIDIDDNAILRVPGPYVAISKLLSGLEFCIDDILYPLSEYGNHNVVDSCYEFKIIDNITGSNELIFDAYS